MGETKEWLEARLQLAYFRLEALKGDKSRSALYERDMHEHDVKLLTAKLNALGGFSRVPNV